MRLITNLLIIAILFSVPHVSIARIPEVVLSKKSAVVSIYVEDKQKIVAGGSGFIIDQNGIIVTNAHVIEPWNKSTTGILYVKKSDGTFLEPTEVIAADAVKDVALVRVKEQNLPFIKLTSNITPTQGDDVVVIGNPLGLETTVTDGIISAIRGEDGFLQISAPISQGSSGSPVLNSKGEAIGVATSIMAGGQNLNFAIPASYVTNLPTQEKAPPVKGLKKRAESPSGFETVTPEDIERDVVQIPEGAVHKGKVLFATDSGGYTYIRIEENGAPLWVAVTQTTISIGDIIEFPDSPPMTGFNSKSMNMTFDKITFAAGIRIVQRGNVEFKSPEEKHLYYAEQYSSMNNTPAAIEEISKAIELNPKKAEYYGKRANYYLQRRMYADSKSDEYQQIVASNRESCRNAVDDLNKAIAINPGNDVFYATQARIFTDSLFCDYANADKAIKLYETAIQLNPKKADYYVEKGWQHKIKNDFSKVLDCAKKALSISPNNEDAHYLYGSYYEENNKYDKALEYYTKGLSVSDNVTFGYFYIDGVMEKTKKYDDAVRIYTDLIKQHPKRLIFYNGRAEYYAKLKNYKKAIADYTTCIKLNPNSEYNYNLRANCYYEDGKKSEALTDYRTACDMKHAESCEMIPIVFADIKRGANWVPVAASSDVNYYYDKKGYTKNKNGVAVAWIRGEITDKEEYIKDIDISEYEKEKYKNVSHVMSRFEVDCPNQKLRVPISLIYAENGNVIRSYEDEKTKYSNIIPNSIGASIHENLCKGAPAKKIGKKK
ncbi:peptidase S1 and S6 chymotrypsin/Hap [Geobacter metallireducens RCH3]|uniref:Serine protease with TPR domains, putative n=1 Tax=Geobacter metallireducens (strain ATCC 53774 / DSM 7210 / GS-15) TaxID=269799 RepID=Q39R57_GEOMG|nr:surface-adhesin E family protein [Geobacter metallireducens]ABB33267.1 serine protease with TPR domains, putative [Geobacter metallireducens GS-15]EHP85845.1 peptidase S1 and S6 chymotrypsin/Hap [Geobacter metallireducens RCH3]